MLAVMYRLSTAKPGSLRKKGGAMVAGLHSDRFAPDPKPTLVAGITTMTLAVLEGLTGGPSK